MDGDATPEIRWLDKQRSALTLEEIEEGLQIVAEIVDRYGSIYLPYFLLFERLKREHFEMKAETEAALARAREIVRRKHR